MTKENWHAIEFKEVMQALHTSPKGLGEKEAKRRLEEFGPDELREEKRITALSVFLDQCPYK